MPYKDKETRKIAERFRLAKRKLRFIQEAGGRCVNCGFSDVPEVLQFHHRNGVEKTYDAAKAPSEAKIRAEIALCDLLCPTCHTLRHVTEEEWRGGRARFIRYPRGVDSVYNLTRGKGRSGT